MINQITIITNKTLVSVLLVCLCALQCNGMPNRTTNTPQPPTNTPTSQQIIIVKSGRDWLGWLAFIPILVALYALFSCIAARLTWNKYHEAKDTAFRFMRTNQENYGIDYSHCIEYDCCWSYCLSCSTICCTQICCQSHPGSVVVRYARNEDAPMIEQNLENRNVQIEDMDFRLIIPSGINAQPVDVWSLENNKLPPPGIQAFATMLDLCKPITYHQFLSNCRSYGGFLRPLNRRSHFYHFGGKKSRHRFYQAYPTSGLALHPVLYYIALDWYDFKTGLANGELLIDIDTCEWFKRLLSANSRDGLTLENITKYRPNICITMINIPSNLETSNEKDNQLALGIMQLFFKLELRDVNIVCRSSENNGQTSAKRGESVWSWTIEDDGENCKRIILALSKTDVKYFPSGCQFELDKQRVYFNQNVESYEVENGESFVKIIVVYSSKQPFRCSIYLGEKEQPVRANLDTRQNAPTPKPCLESPEIEGCRELRWWQPIWQQLRSKIFGRFYGEQDNIRSLSGDLDKQRRWYHLGQKIFNGITSVLKRFNELNNKITAKQNEAFLKALQLNKPQLSWEEFKDVGVRQFDINALDETNIKPKDKRLSEMHEDELKEISNALKADSWRSFATNIYGDVFQAEELEKIENAYTEVSEPLKPTEYLYEMIKENKADFTMQSFLNACDELGYDNVIKNAEKIYQREQEIGKCISLVDTSGSTEGSKPIVKKQKTDKQKIQDLINLVDESLLFKDVYNNQKNRNELSADLNHNKRWYRVGEKIYRGREDEKYRLPELNDINNELSKQNRAFLVALQKKYGSLTWVEFKRIGIEEHEISELSDVEPRGETIGGFSEDDLDLVSRALPETAWELYATNTFKDKFQDFQITNIQNAFKGEFKPTSDLVDKINTNIPGYKMVDFLQICATLGYNDVIEKAVKTCVDMVRLRDLC
ncbi:uncharacterized protein [Clytia hemisphaerica]|uniref:uncharacterized protein isoform X2 n=1 Tax=Clytia hemisphaerica TaxID=252671 RepID=UPI0034D3FFF5